MSEVLAAGAEVRTVTVELPLIRARHVYKKKVRMVYQGSRVFKADDIDTEVAHRAAGGWVSDMSTVDCV